MNKLLISTILLLAIVHSAAAQEKSSPEVAPKDKAVHEKNAKEKTAQEKIAQKKAAQEKEAQAKKAAEEKAAKEKLAKEKAAQEKAAQERAISIFESSVPPKPAGQIDEIVFARLKSLDIQPGICSDAVFVRRAYLDVTGTIPTAEEANAFIQNPDTENKRRALIDFLLKQDSFADYQAMKWGDILRIKAEFPVNLWPNAAQAYHHWIRTSIAENKPYDKFVREMLTSSGSNFRVPPVNFYRAIQNRTQEGTANAVALAFMGTRTDSWPTNRLAGMAVFFSQIGYKPTSEWKEECVFWDPNKSSVMATSIAPGRDRIITFRQVTADKSNEVAVASLPSESVTLQAMFPDGTGIELAPDKDPREVFADWLITPANPWFARSVVNRVWAWMMGRGIIHEPDDIREDNPPGNPELLACLEKEFIASHYDMRALYRLILTSTTYQFSSIPRSQNPQAELNFASYPLRRLDAEVLIDAINKITGTSDLYTSPIPEPFTFIPNDMPAVAIADGSITSSFLALFGRSARATGMENERINKQIPSQWLHMLNSGHIQRKLEQGPKLKAIFNAKLKGDEKLVEIYLTILSRMPTEEEITNAIQYGKTPQKNQSGKKTEAEKKAAWQKQQTDWVDIAWSLINSSEFIYRH